MANIDGLNSEAFIGLKLTPTDYLDTTVQAMSENIAQDYKKIIEVSIQADLEKSLNLKLKDIRILACLSAYDSPLIPAKIASLLKYDRATITRAMHTLKERDLVTLEADPLDRRSIRYSLTGEGRTISALYISKVTDLFSALNEIVSHTLSQTEKDRFLDKLFKLNKRSHAMLEAAKRLARG